MPAGARGRFWSSAIRRFSAVAMSCLAAIAAPGLFLYWQHVDEPAQLVTTMYGRVLGVKILIFGTLLALGAASQFWLHPCIEALRAAAPWGRPRRWRRSSPRLPSTPELRSLAATNDQWSATGFAWWLPNPAARPRNVDDIH
jgi:hypothetical protein